MRRMGDSADETEDVRQMESLAAIADSGRPMQPQPEPAGAERKPSIQDCHRCKNTRYICSASQRPYGECDCGNCERGPITRTACPYCMAPTVAKSATVQPDAIRELLEKSEALIALYVANLGTKDEFISCITPPVALVMGPDERKKNKAWIAWDDLRAAIARVRALEGK